MGLVQWSSLHCNLIQVTSHYKVHFTYYVAIPQDILSQNMMHLVSWYSHHTINVICVLILAPQQRSLCINLLNVLLHYTVHGIQFKNELGAGTRSVCTHHMCTIRCFCFKGTVHVLFYMRIICVQFIVFVLKELFMYFFTQGSHQTAAKWFDMYCFYDEPRRATGHRACWRPYTNQHWLPAMPFYHHGHCLPCI